MRQNIKSLQKYGFGDHVWTRTMLEATHKAYVSHTKDMTDEGSVELDIANEAVTFPNVDDDGQKSKQQQFFD